MKMKCVLFCRVSSREQEETGYSLPSQERLLKEYVNKKAFTITKVFSISESASGKSQRQTFKEMMDLARKKKIKIIVCEKVDRLTRNFKDAVLIDDWLENDSERQVHLVKDSLVMHKDSRSQEKLNWGIRILFAKNYTDNLSEEVKKGYKEKVCQGWMPHIPPIGYKSVGEKGHKIHVVDEKYVHYVQKVFKLYSSGNYSLKRLEKQMYEDGFRSKRGNKVYSSKIHEILTNPFYIGRFRWGNKVHKGNQKPLVSKELFERVQTLLNSRATPLYTKHNYLFKSLIRCKECTGLITWEQHKGYIYGHCNHHRECTQKKWIRQSEVESILSKIFDNLKIQNSTIHDWIKKALKESHKDETVYHTNSIQGLNKQYERVKNRIDKLYDDKLDDKISESFYDQKFTQYTREKEKINKALETHSKADTRYLKQGVDVFNLSQRLQNVFDKANVDDKRELLRYVFARMTLDERKLEYEYTPAFKLLQVAVKATNRSSKTYKSYKNDDDNFELTKNPGIVVAYEDFLIQNPVVRG